MLRTLTPLALLALAALAAPDDALLLHYPFDAGEGTVARDASGNGLDATGGAVWVDTPAGGGVALDGTPATVLKVTLPEGQRLGTDSWTFSAWLKPQQFSIDDRQNQRRLFAYGTFPDAYLVIDLGGDGRLMYYFSYRGADEKIVSSGGSTGFTLPLDAWTHITLVCDRQAGRVSLYANGFAQAQVDLPPGFAGDYSVNGELTLGSGWHNYWGTMDEAKLWRRALDRGEVKAEFRALQEAFGVEDSPEAAAAERREALQALMDEVDTAWAAGDFDTVRRHCAELAASDLASPQLRSYAHLRAAQSLLAQDKLAEAREAYAAIAASELYPDVHRREAAQLVGELTRRAAGQPARVPGATRTPIPAIDAFAAEVFVAPDGRDTADGAAERPVASLARARDRVRQMKAEGVDGPIAVTVLPGEYRVSGPLELGAEDSGTPEAPIVWRAQTPGSAVFYGGTRLDGFAPVTDAAILERLPEAGRGKVLQVDLQAQGITDYGELAVRGFGQAPSPPTLELFVDGEPMTLARWPNEGFVGIRELVQPGSRQDGTPSVIGYLDERHERWLEAEDPWLFGYFHFLWADATLKIAEIDPVAKTLTSAEPYHYGGRGMDTRQGIQYYAFNLLEEIDTPGEWYLDRERGKLYLYPPGDLADATVEIGLLSTPMLTMDGVSDVRLEGLAFDLARHHGLRIANCQRVLVAGCTISRFAGNGIMIHGGERNTLYGCDIHTIGRRASEVIGGDRETLTPGGHLVENCRIHNFGRIDRTYTPAIQLEGVGHRVAHNLMYDCPSSVMRIEGNDHLIEFNEVHSAVQESDDQGAMELFANPSYRGVVFRHNRFTNVGKTGSEAAVHGQAAIRFDDAISGMVVYGNIFIRSANGNFGAVQMNSGRDNVMDNNLFVDCKQGISGGWNAGNNVWRGLREGTPRAGIFLTDLYLQRYPQIATMLDEPAVNHLWRNVFYRCGRVARSNTTLLDMVDNAVIDEEQPALLDAATGGPAIDPGAELFAHVGFRPIPAGEIGLYESPYRASWPVETTPVDVPDWREAAGH